MGWVDSRNWKSLWLGLPAVMLAAAVMGTLWIGQQTSDRHWFKVYQGAAASALNGNNFASADVYFRRMSVIDGSSPVATYGMALTAASQGDEARARALMRRIAPDDVAGYPPAHLWLAHDTLKLNGKLTPQMGRVVEHHLLQALAGNESNAEIHLLLGRLYLSQGDVGNATAHFITASQQRPEVKMTLAVLFAIQKNTIASQQAAMAARDYFRRKAEAEPKTPEYRLQWAKCEMFLEHYAEALHILHVGLESADPRRFEEAMADVYLYWCESTPDREKGGLARRLELLEQSLKHNPRHPHALMLLAELATKDRETADWPSSEPRQAPLTWSLWT
jgi:Tfp pilus assembly protein PilF